MKIGSIEVHKGLLLAPMEDVTDPPFRRICKRLGADVVYTEFISSEGLIRDARRAREKLFFFDGIGSIDGMTQRVPAAPAKADSQIERSIDEIAVPAKAGSQIKSSIKGIASS